MNAKREATGAGQRLFHNDREIGFIRGATVGFVGFANDDEAALAGQVAHLALARHRKKQGIWAAPKGADRLVVRHGTQLCVVAAPSILAVLIPPSPLTPGDGDWGVELELCPDERYDLLAISRARLMWAAMVDAGLVGRMRQFRNGWSAASDDRVTVQTRAREPRGGRRWLRWPGRARMP